MVIPKTYKCKDCGLVFGVVISEEEIGRIPCPGCASKNLEESAEKIEFYWLSSAADECSGDCACCKLNCANKAE